MNSCNNTGYRLVLVNYIGAGNCGGLKCLADKAVADQPVFTVVI